MAWHTVDGIILSVLGLYLVLISKSSIHIFFGGSLLILSALAKQPFLLISILTLIWFIYLKHYKKVIIYTTGMLSVIIIFIVYLTINDSLSNFLSQVSGETKLSDLFNVGF